MLPSLPAQQRVPATLAVREITSPRELSNGIGAYGAYFPVGDYDRDGLMDVLGRGYLFDPVSWGVIDPLPLWLIPGGPMVPTARVSLDLAPYFASRVIVLRTPTGDCLAINNYSDPGSPMQILTIPGGRLVAELHSFSLPGLPPTGPMFAYLNAMDVDRDGYDDLLFQAWTLPQTGQPLYDVLGLISGRTQQPLWLHYGPDNYGYALYQPPFARSWPDLDQDGVVDFPISYLNFDNSWEIKAFSGLDGHVIWSYYEAPNPNFMHMAMHMPDMTGDGVWDVLSVRVESPGDLDEGSLHLLDGETGTTVWETTLSYLDPWWPDIANRVSVDGRPFGIGDIDRDGVLDIGLSTEFLQLGQAHTRVSIACFSGSDGAFLTYLDLPSTLGPWWPNDQGDEIPTQRILWPLGDIDGDGWAEVDGYPYAEEWSTQHGWFPKFKHAVIYGIRTLDGPASFHLLDTVELHLDLPALAGRPFQILASTAFLGNGTGLHEGDYDLFLGPTPLLTATQGSPVLRGTLDAQGKATVRGVFPRVPALLGHDLYLIGGAGSLSTRFVKTSLLVSHVLP